MCGPLKRLIEIYLEFPLQSMPQLKYTERSSILSLVLHIHSLSGGVMFVAYTVTYYLANSRCHALDTTQITGGRLAQPVLLQSRCPKTKITS